MLQGGPLGLVSMVKISKLSDKKPKTSSDFEPQGENMLALVTYLGNR